LLARRIAGSLLILLPTGGGSNLQLEVLGIGAIWDEIPAGATVIPAKAGIHSVDGAVLRVSDWFPALAGMTSACSGLLSYVPLAILNMN